MEISGQSTPKVDFSWETFFHIRTGEVAHSFGFDTIERNTSVPLFGIELQTFYFSSP